MDNTFIKHYIKHIFSFYNNRYIYFQTRILHANLFTETSTNYEKQGNNACFPYRLSWEYDYFSDKDDHV